uniref:transmembrane protein 243 isoform X2 n=1 Tax=Jaculus jaculus TaxID=51337 RepID=UPI001E1B5BED|nr:transmembrane protein 243 isoform X2 [Jaculus jaculus]
MPTSSSVTWGERTSSKMEDFAPRTYGTSGLDNRPLFGETSAKDRVINLVVGSLTSLLILVTLISAFVFPQLPPRPLNIFFAVCISLSSITACILWEGEAAKRNTYQDS